LNLGIEFKEGENGNYLMLPINPTYNKNILNNLLTRFDVD
jgi:hypothetical protein